MKTKTAFIALVWGLGALLGGCNLFSGDAPCALDSECPEGMTCTASGCKSPEGEPDPVCESHSYSLCESGNSLWYDSCDRRQTLREHCRGEPCEEGECLSPTCEDGRRNAQETDVDCSGHCLPCIDGAGCLVGGDCQSGVCVDRICQEAVCDDGVHNGGESDLDCGGECPGCDTEQACGGDEDCESNTCQEGRCVMVFCSDGEQNGFETDVDCGGTGCGACEAGGACGVAADCVSLRCEGGTCGGFSCPDGMVRIGESAGCVDPYEATLFPGTACEGEPLGTGDEDDLPAGFPDNVASEGCSGTCGGVNVVEPSVEVMACSVLGLLPSAHVTWFQARRACENAGKHLCRLPGEWRSACRGDPPGVYPYGDDYEPGRCNGGEAGNGMSVPTGSRAGCHGRGFAEALYDMSGNVWEWTNTCSAGCLQGGGAFSDILGYLSCEEGTLSASPEYSGRFTGFRCCWSPEDTPG